MRAAKAAARSVAAAGALEFKHLSNPFSTGGGGPRFESRVQSAFVVLMLTGGVAPCLPPWPISEIKFQGKYAGFETDDFIAFAEERPGGRKARLLAQIKHTLTISTTDAVFGEVIQAAWADFKNPKVFDPENDTIAVITGPLSALDNDNARFVLEMARHCGGAEEFFEKIDRAYFSSAAKQKKLAAFAAQLERANGGVALAKEELWRFLKCYHLLGYDLDLKSGVTLSLLKSHIGQFSLSNIDGLWASISQEVQDFNSHAGTMNRDTVPTSLRTAFKERVRQEQLSTPSAAAPGPVPAPAQFAGAHADALKLLVLAGAVNEKSPADLAAIQKLMGE